MGESDSRGNDRKNGKGNGELHFSPLRLRKGAKASVEMTELWGATVSVEMTELPRFEGLEGVDALGGSLVEVVAGFGALGAVVDYEFFLVAGAAGAP